MDIFETEAETWALGAPVVRLFRTGLGRDPDPAELASYVSLLRRGETQGELASELARTEAFRRRHGDVAAADEKFVERVCKDAFGGNAVAAERAARLGTAAGASRAEVLTLLASSTLARAVIPVLPGITPGAPPDDPLAYRIWTREYDTPGADALAALPALSAASITVAMLVGDTTAEAALRTAESLMHQVYSDWTLWLAIRALAPWPRAALERLARIEPRVRLVKPRLGEASALLLNKLVMDGPGVFACLLTPGDRLAPTALYEAVSELGEHPDCVLIHTDEDRLDGESRRAPRFKPTASPDAMLIGDAIGQLALYQTEFFRDLGGLRAEAAPHETYDLACRALLSADGRIRHIPAVLCHRESMPSSSPLAAGATRPALPGLAGVEFSGTWPRARFRVPNPPPLVSILVPTRDHPDLLSSCVSGVLERTEYAAIELIIIDNGSRTPDSLGLLAAFAQDSRVRVLRRDVPFNFAALNNEAAALARGELLLLLNDDVEVLEPTWLGELVAHACRPDVGAVGARLLYPDGTIQHAGMLLGPNGAAVHVGRGAAADDPGYLGQLACTRELSAVTGACLAIRRDVWARVGGMDERLAVTWNDVDLCLRVRAAGLRVLWTPHATLRHREGATRGSDAEDEARQARFESERSLVQSVWGAAMESDPFLNPNLVATEIGPLALTRPRRRRPWES